jgi:MFS superfamily sulfate permease-like transporter
MFPRDGLLGRIEGRHGFFDLQRYPEARPVEGAAVFAVQGSILFYNADYVRIRLTSVVKELPAETKCLVLDASAISQIDSTGATALEAVADTLAKRNIVFAITDLSEDSRAILERAGVIKAIGAHHLFNGREEALRTLIGDIDQIRPAASAGNAP